MRANSLRCLVRRLPTLVVVVLLFQLAACMSIGPQRLDEDQLGYTRALTMSEKRETLLNAVRMRYADTPSFLQVNQVISGYQLQRSATAGYTAFPGAGAGNTLAAGGTIQLQQSPTFTFQPITGEQFAQSFIRPLSPTELLPLSLSGLPIDVLFRLGIQSVNSLQNARPIEHTDTAGSPDFFLLLHDLRVLQEAGLLGVKLQPASPGETAKGSTDKDSKVSGKAYLLFGTSDDAELKRVAAETRRLLGIPLDSAEAEFVYGRAEPGTHQIGVLTRSMLGVLGELASQIEVPENDVKSGRTIASVAQVGVETKPTVTIHSGPSAPADAFVSIEYKTSWYWIDDNDFDSKYAFTVVNLLLNLARTSTAAGAVVTIPAG